MLRSSCGVSQSTSKPISHVHHPYTYCRSLNHFQENCSQKQFRGSRHSSAFASTGGTPYTCDPSAPLFILQLQPPSEHTSIPFLCSNFNKGVHSWAQWYRFCHVCSNCEENVHANRDCHFTTTLEHKFPCLMKVIRGGRGVRVHLAVQALLFP